MKDIEYYLSFTKETESGCKEWQRCLNTDGYARAVIRGNSNGKVHREVCALHTGQDLTGLVVRHTCDNPKCINPDHLVVGSFADNNRDRDKRQRNGQAKLTHDQVRAIRALADKFKRTELARMFNVDARTISSTVLGHHWKHVE
jgi:hypothetical protein